MSNEQKTALSLRLKEMIRQLERAQEATESEKFTLAAVYVGNVQNQLPMMRMALARN